MFSAMDSCLLSVYKRLIWDYYRNIVKHTIVTGYYVLIPRAFFETETIDVKYLLIKFSIYM